MELHTGPARLAVLALSHTLALCKPRTCQSNPCGATRLPPLARSPLGRHLQLTRVLAMLPALGYAGL